MLQKEVDILTTSVILDSVMRKIMKKIKSWLFGEQVRTKKITYIREYDGRTKDYFVNIFEDWASHYVAYTYDQAGRRAGIKRFNKDNVLNVEPWKAVYEKVA